VRVRVAGLRGAAAAAAAGVLTAAGIVLLAGPATADDVDCSAWSVDDPQRQASGASLPLQSLDVAAAQALVAGRGGDAGEGVRVAVVDSGVTTRSGRLDVVGGERFSRTSELRDYHGSAVAGLIAGDPRLDGEPVGVAPGADIVDVRVYDAAEPTAEDEVGVDPALVVEGLAWVADHADDLDIGVVNVSLAVGPSEALRRVVHELVTRHDVVVVAAAGNRPTSAADPLYSGYAEPHPGEDAAADVFPAGYLDDVVAVSATAGGFVDEDGATADPRQYVLPSSATDVAAPTWGAVSLAVNGSTCSLTQVATSWATAEVSGVVALLRARYPDEDAAQITARLLATADGTLEQQTLLTGAGVVQPVEALTRPLTPTRDGSLGRATTSGSDLPAAASPAPRSDPLDLAREHALWWGLVGGAVLVLALLARPLVLRRR
jgi:membrane-anchored mycosin MYCP